MAHLTKDDVLKLARLSKLDLNDEQLDRFRVEIDAIVGYVELLQSVDAEGLEPSDQVTGLQNVTRPDEVREYVSQEALLKNLPDREADQIKVKRMIG